MVWNILSWDPKIKIKVYKKGFKYYALRFIKRVPLKWPWKTLTNIAKKYKNHKNCPASLVISEALTI